MPVAELHFFHFDDPNGSTIFECSTDDQFVKGIELDIQRDSLGGGKVTFARRVPAGGLFQRDIIVPETLVRVLIPSVHPTKYLHAFFINPRQQQVVSKAEQGGKGFTFAGPGPKHYLTRRVLFSQSFSGRNSLVDRDAGIWEFSENAAAGQIWAWLVEEDQDQPAGPFLPDLTVSFGTMLDSNGVPWVDDIATAGEPYVLRMQDDYLKILWLLEDASTSLVTQFDLGEVGAPLLELGAYQTYGRDLTGPIGADTVHFTEGVNIASDLDVEGSSYRKASHALVRGNDGAWQTAIKPGWSGATDLKKLVGIRYDSANGATLIRMGERYLRRQDFGEQQIDLRIVPGFDPESGLYMPGPEGTDGQFWIGDSVDLSTGMGAGTALDYQSESQGVTGIELELEEAVRDDTDEMAARSFKVTVHLNEERKSGRTSVDLAGSRGTVQSSPSLLKLCKALVPGTETVLRLYPSFTGAVATFATLAVDAAWNVDDAGATKTLTTAPAANYTSGSSTNSDDGNGDDIALWQGVYEIPSGLAAILAAGGAVIRGQFQTNTRNGIGISEANQDIISQLGLRVTTGLSTTIRGTALALHNLSSSAGSTKWHTTNNERNRVFPPAAANTVLSAVSGAAAGDYLIVEAGMRNFTTSPTGGTLHLNNDSPDDLPEDESTMTPDNCWIEFRSVSAPSGSGDHPDLVGTGSRAARCDHKHHVLSDRAPTVDDDADQGYPTTTQWTNTATGQTFLLLDADTGDWFLISDPNHTHDIPDPVEVSQVWEAVTNGEDIFVWEDDDLVHEWREL